MKYLLVLLLFPLLLHAEPWYKNKKFWVGAAVNGIVVGLDQHSSAAGQPRYAESGFLSNIAGKHPSDKAFALWGTAAFTTYFTCHALSYHWSHNDPNKYWRFYGAWQIPAIATAIHLPTAIHNYQLNAKPCIVHFQENTVNVCTGGSQ